MEKLGLENGDEIMFMDETLKDMITRGMLLEEAKEAWEATIAFPRTPQLLYPMEREDGIIGQHYNLTKIPFDIQVNPGIGSALDFHVEIHFEVHTKTPLFHDDVKSKVTKRLLEMNSPLGKTR